MTAAQNDPPPRPPLPIISLSLLTHERVGRGHALGAQLHVFEGDEGDGGVHLLGNGAPDRVQHD